MDEKKTTKHRACTIAGKRVKLCRNCYQAMYKAGLIQPRKYIRKPPQSQGGSNAV